MKRKNWYRSIVLSACQMIMSGDPVTKLKRGWWFFLVGLDLLFVCSLKRFARLLDLPTKIKLGGWHFICPCVMYESELMLFINPGPVLQLLFYENSFCWQYRFETSSHNFQKLFCNFVVCFKMAKRLIHFRLTGLAAENRQLHCTELSTGQ